MNQRDAIGALAPYITASELAVLRLRVGGASLRTIASHLHISKAGASEAERKAGRRLCDRLTESPALFEHWSALLGSGVIAESDLLESGGDPELTELGRVLLWAGLGARPARWGRSVIPGYWMRRRDSLDFRAGALIDQMPLSDAELEAATPLLGLPAALATMVLGMPTSPVARSIPAGGWVRRRVATRDAAVLLLRRWGRPASSAALARVLDTPRSALLYQLGRDARFVRLPARRQWALAVTSSAWSDERHRTTGEAIRAVLSASGPLTTRELMERMRSTYPVSDTSVRRWLRHKDFGRFDDGRWGFAADGAIGHYDVEPRRPSDVEVSGDRIRFVVPVTDDAARGSWVPIPPYVGWWIGLRRVPERRSFARAEGGPPLVVARRPGHTSVSSLRPDIARLACPVGGRLFVVLDRAQHSATVEKAP